MTEFEKNLRYMLIDSEIELLDRVLVNSTSRDGAIASLVSYALSQKRDNGLLDILHPKTK